MGRLFITGDIHGCIEANRLNSRIFPEGRELCPDDFVIVAGDFGLPWSWPESGEDRYWLDWLESKPWTTLFVDGNHENYSALIGYPVEEWRGGKAQRIRPSVIHLMRGEMYDICGLSLFAFGGARSVDQACRTEGVSWWPQEMASEEEKRHGRQTLAEHGWKADIVVTHCAPANFLHSIDPVFANDPMTEYLFELERSLEYGYWYLGHYHVDKDIGWAQATVAYDRILEIDTSSGKPLRECKTCCEGDDLQ